MATNQSSNDPLENLLQATASVGERVEERTAEVLEVASETVIERASNIAEVANEKATNLVDNTVEKTAENSTKSEVIQAVADKGQTNVAASYAAASASIAADTNLSDDQRKIIQARMNEISLSQDRDIAPSNMQVAIIEQQRMHEKNQELNA